MSPAHLPGAGVPGVSPSRDSRLGCPAPRKLRAREGLHEAREALVHGTCIGGVAQHCLTEQAAHGGPCRAGQAAKERLVPPRQLRRDGLGSSQASSICPPHRQCRNLPKIRQDWGGGGHMKFRGFVQENAVMFVCSLGLQNFPSGSIPSTPAGFDGVTPFYNRTLIPLAPRKHKGNPQNN